MRKGPLKPRALGACGKYSLFSIDNLSIIDMHRGIDGIPKVSSTEFQQNVGRYQDMAQRTPVAITKNGRGTHDHDVGRAFSKSLRKVGSLVRSRTADDETLERNTRAPMVAGRNMPISTVVLKDYGRRDAALNRKW